MTWGNNIWHGLKLWPVSVKASLLFGITLFLHGVFVFVAGPKETNDTSIYLEHVNTLIESGDYGVPDRPPGFPAMLVLLSEVFGGYPKSVLVYHVVLSGLTISATYLAGRNVFGETVGLLAGLYMLIYLPLVDHLRYILSETQFVFLTVAALAILTMSNSRTPRLTHFVGGLILGLASLTRNTALMYLPFIVILGLTRFGLPKAQIRDRMKLIVILLVGWAVVVGPWTIRNYLRYEIPVLVSSQGGFVLYTSTLDEFIEFYNWGNAPVEAAKIAGTSDPLSPEAQGPLIRYSVSQYIEYPLRMLRLRALTFIYFWWPVEHEFLVFSVDVMPHMIYRWTIYGLLLPFSIIGTYFVIRYRKSGTYYLFASVLGTAVITTLTHFELRYRLPIAPMLILLAMFGAVNLYRHRTDNVNSDWLNGKGLDINTKEASQNEFERMTGHLGDDVQGQTADGFPQRAPRLQYFPHRLERG